MEANIPTTGSLNRAVDAAVAAGTTVTNHSYGIQEYGAVVRANRHYDHDGVTAVAASATSRPVFPPRRLIVSVGGTALRRASNSRGWRESAWAGPGSGCSAYFAKPSWQHDRACHMRMFADVSAGAAPNTGVAVYDSFGIQGQRGWFVVGGTSVASPFVAGMIAAADAGALRPGDLYGDPGLFRDVVRGTNGWCLHSYVCSAKPGYDGRSHGVGDSPRSRQLRAHAIVRRIDQGGGVLRVGLTGGIGAGKSEVSRRLQALGAAVIDSDALAREVVGPGSDGLAEVVAEFGDQMVRDDGSLDRGALAAHVFADEAARQRLEEIIHPRVRRRAAAAEKAAGPHPIVVHDVPLLVETNRQRDYDVVVVVDVPEQVQADRLVSTRGMSEADARARIQAQAARAVRLAAADIVIDNAGSLSELDAAVVDLWRILSVRVAAAGSGG